MTIRPYLIALPLMALGWVLTLVTVGLFSDAAPAQVVLFPREGLLQSLNDETAILGHSRWSVTLAAPEPGFAASLYKKGAWIVLPAGLPGCLPLPGA